LAELIACKDLQDRIESGAVFGRDSNYEAVAHAGAEYKRRAPLAWEAARAALQKEAEWNQRTSQQISERE
jgi:hypothetical protein